MKLVWIGLVALAGCSASHEFQCAQSSQCAVGAVAGTCEPTGFCSHPDPDCPSGSRYDDASGDGLDGTCVGLAPPVDAALDAADAAIDAPVFPPFDRKLHLGGPQVIGSDYPGTWEADFGYPECGSANQETFTPDIHGTVDDALFAQGVWSFDLTCSFTGLPAGVIRVTMPMAEVYYNCQGNPQMDRIVDVKLNGSGVPSIDFGVLGGGCAVEPDVGHPFVVTYDVTITTGTLNLEMMAQAGGVIFAIDLQRIQ